MSMKDRDRARFEARKAEQQFQRDVQNPPKRKRSSRERGLDAVARSNYDFDRDDYRDISPESE